jgi:hypothetical protein
LLFKNEDPTIENCTTTFKRELSLNQVGDGAGKGIVSLCVSLRLAAGFKLDDVMNLGAHLC